MKLITRHFYSFIALAASAPLLLVGFDSPSFGQGLSPEGSENAALKAACLGEISWPIAGTADTADGARTYQCEITIDIGPDPDAEQECSGSYGPTPTFRLIVAEESGSVAILVNSGSDTTLKIEQVTANVAGDQQISTLCNDDNDFLHRTNPGIYLSEPEGNAYDISIGAFSSLGGTISATVFITDLSPSLEWRRLMLPDSVSYPLTTSISGGILNFGLDMANWAMDGECDDPRFIDAGQSASTSLFANSSDQYNDASDCKEAYEEGEIRMIPGMRQRTPIGLVVFGDDSGDWSHDGECDDPQFRESEGGIGMAQYSLDNDRFRDASDCQSLYQSGLVELDLAPELYAELLITDQPAILSDIDQTGVAVTVSQGAVPEEAQEPLADAGPEETQVPLADAAPAETQEPVEDPLPDFGDDSGVWSNDGECDDPRFENTDNGFGMAYQLSSGSRLSDATDCNRLLEEGRIRVIPELQDTEGLRLVGSDAIEQRFASPDIDANDSHQYCFDSDEPVMPNFELRSTEFDTLLEVNLPNNELLENDDYNGNLERSRIEVDQAQSGTFQVMVRSFSGSLGNYELAYSDIEYLRLVDCAVPAEN